jgi:hypothetical protein
MAEDLQSAEARDQQMRSKAGRRDHFPKRAAWQTSAKGTPYIKVDGYHLMLVSKRDGTFSVGASRPGSKETVWGKRRYATIEAAQKGCFDAWQHLAGA